jgi:acetoin utilization deacetylase AcuC-like enzyme
VNIAWSASGVADADYIYAFSTLVIPLVYEYRPA